MVEVALWCSLASFSLNSYNNIHHLLIVFQSFPLDPTPLLLKHWIEFRSASWSYLIRKGFHLITPINTYPPALISECFMQHTVHFTDLVNLRCVPSTLAPQGTDLKNAIEQRLRSPPQHHPLLSERKGTIWVLVHEGFGSLEVQVCRGTWRSST